MTPPTQDDPCETTLDLLVAMMHAILRACPKARHVLAQEDQQAHGRRRTAEKTCSDS